MAARLRAGEMEMLERRTRELELPGRLEADRAVGAGQGDDLAAFLDRLPAKLGHRHQQVANAAGLVIGGRAMVGAAIDELLVLGADPPRILRFLTAREGREQIVAGL